MATRRVLVVTKPFADFKVGDRISDPEMIEKVSEIHWDKFVPAEHDEESFKADESGDA